MKAYFRDHPISTLIVVGLSVYALWDIGSFLLPKIQALFGG